MLSFKAVFFTAILGVGFLSGSAFSASSSFRDQLYDNASMGSPLLGLIQHAKRTIDIEIYQMGDSQVLSAVKAAVDRGVRVRVVQEANTVGASCHVFDPISADDTDSCVTQKHLVHYIRNHGGTYVAFNADLCGTPGAHCFQHGKMILVDSSQVMMSTGNFNASTLCDKKDNPSTCNRDYSIVTQDPLVLFAIESVFSNDLIGKTYDVRFFLTGLLANRLTVSPYSLNPLLTFIRSAKKSIQIENQYLKDPNFNGALIDAAKRGVKVFVMVASLCSFGKPEEPKDHAKIQSWTDVFTAFDRAGIHTQIFTEKMSLNGLPGYLHAKVILVDGVRGWIGSVNGSSTSLSENREFGLFTAEKQPIQLLSKLLYQDYVNPNAETWQESIVCKKDYGVASPTEDPPPGE